MINRYENINQTNQIGRVLEFIAIVDICCYLFFSVFMKFMRYSYRISIKRNGMYFYAIQLILTKFYCTLLGNDICSHTKVLILVVFGGFLCHLCCIVV